METLLSNVGTIITSIVDWLGNIASALISNQIFQIILAVILFTIVYNLILSVVNYIRIKSLAIGLTGSTDELEYYRSLSDEEKEKYNETHI